MLPCARTRSSATVLFVLSFDMTFARMPRLECGFQAQTKPSIHPISCKTKTSPLGPTILARSQVPQLSTSSGCRSPARNWLSTLSLCSVLVGAGRPQVRRQHCTDCLPPLLCARVSRCSQFENFDAQAGLTARTAA